MDSDFKKCTDFLVGMGVAQVPHTHKTYLGHLIAVHRDLGAQGFPEDVRRAGLFHSIYGTQRFQGFTLPLERRGEIRALIGERAERLAYINCAMDRASFDRALERTAEPYPVRDRLTGKEEQMSLADFDDLCRVHLFDYLEQAERLGEWDYRRAAYRRMALRLGPGAVQAYDKVFAAEPRDREPVK